MIAVWLVGPPSSVTIASTWPRSRVAVSAGARSAATSTDGCPGAGMPGLGSAEQPGDDPVADVARSVTRSAMYGPAPRQARPELGECVRDRPGCRLAVGDAVGDEVVDCGVLRHERLGLRICARLPRPGGARLQVLGYGGDQRPRARSARPPGRPAPEIVRDHRGRRDSGHRTGHDAGAHAQPGQLLRHEARFVVIGLQDGGQCVEGLLGVVTVGVEHHLVALVGVQRQHGEDAAGVDRLAARLADGHPHLLVAAAWTNSEAGRACSPTREPTVTRRSAM